MDNIKFDFNNMLEFSVGAKHGITETALSKIAPSAVKAHSHLNELLKNKDNRINLGLEWARLPFQDEEKIKEIQVIGKEIAGNYENVIFLGIGGSYLGLKAAQDALAPVYYNDFTALRKGHPRIYFEGNNLDPDTLKVLLENLNPKKTFVVVISKSGETTETKAAFMVLESWLKKSLGKSAGQQIFAITDPLIGTLRKRIEEEQKNDVLSFRNIPLLKGVGGRFSELNMGLLHLAIIGIDIKEILNGAKEMHNRCIVKNLFKNPACMYAVLHVMLYKTKGKSIAVMMPFSEKLKSTADWYSQLLAESLGKKYSRKIRVNPDGTESWLADKSRIVNAGRTPIASRGTNDLHSIQQNNVEGENNKVVTFIRVEKFENDIAISGSGNNDILNARHFSELIKLAQEATEWALVRESRPNCAISMPVITPFYWGGLLFFFEMATAFEGELLNINAFDQPGVEGYKNYMYYKLHKPNIPYEITEEIKNNPLVKKPRFIIKG